MNRQWEAFNQISRMLDSNQSIMWNIHNIIEIIIDSIPQADAGFFLLWKKDLQCLTIDAAVNFQEEHYVNTRILLNEGISGKVYSSGKGMILNNKTAIQSAMDNMRKPNVKYYLDSFVHYGTPKNCISVPIEYDNERFGVFTVDNFLHEGDFSIADFNFLQAIATQVAIAIRLSSDIQKQQKKTQDLETILKNHHKLNQLVLDGQNMEQLLQCLDSITDDPYYFLDSLGNFKFSTRRNHYLQIDINDNLRDSLLHKQYNVYSEDNHTYSHIFTISSSFYVNGFVVLQSTSEYLPISKQLTITHASSIMAMEQMKKRTTFEKELQKRHTLFSALKENNHSTEFYTACTNYLINYKYFSIILIDHPFLNSSDFTVILEIESKINKSLTSAKVILIPHESQTYCLIATLNNDEEAVHQIIQQHLPKATLFIGRHGDTYDKLHFSYMDIQFITLINQAAITTAYTSFKDLGIFRYLLLMDDQEKSNFVYEELHLILAEKNHRELLDTLFTYFKCQKNASLTAKTLHLHINSIYYRLSQIETILQIKLSDFQINMNLYSALFLEKYLFEKNKTASLTTI